MKWNRWIVGLAAISTITVGAARAHAQTAKDGAVPTVTAEQLDLSRVASDRQRIIGEVLEQWRSQLRPANPALNDDGGLAELTSALQNASADKLLAATRAQTFEELMGLLARRQQPGVIPLEGGSIPNVLGSTAGDLVLTPVTPCRIVDTRYATTPSLAGRIGPNAGKQFQLNLANYAGQGGYAGSCGIDFNVPAVVINLTSVDQTGNGNLRVVPTGAGVPNTSLLNYTPGVNIANSAVVAAASTGADDIFVYSGNSASHVIVDVLGYVTAPEATALDCTTVVATISGPAGVGQTAGAIASCAAGYTLAGAAAYEPSGTNSIYINKLDFQSNTSLFCRITNNTGGALSSECQARCCRVPGR